MRAVESIRRVLSPLLDLMAARRIESLFVAVRALLAGRRLTLTAVGRAVHSRAATKHAIKRIDRLLGNRHLHKELPLIFNALAHWLIGDARQVVLLMDWSQLDDHRCVLLAAVPALGRAIPLAYTVQPINRLGNRTVQKRFLNTVQRIVPARCRPVVVTDAGFGNPWFDHVRALGWDFVGRLRGRVGILKPGATQWRLASTVSQDAGTTAVCLGTCGVGRSQGRHRFRVILGSRFIRNPLRGPQRRRRGDRGRGYRRTVARAQQPWILATSLQDHSPQQVIDIYARRMQIEETFRDAKNHRFGFSLRDARAQTDRRFEVLLIIGVLAMVAAMVLGRHAEQCGVHRRFQANTVRNRRVLSLFFLGLQLIDRKDLVHLTSSQIPAIIDDLTSTAVSS